MWLITALCRLCLVRRTRFPTVVIVLGLALPQAGHADIYSHVDEDGAVHLSNHATDRRFALFIREPAPSGRAAPLEPPSEAMPYAELVDEAAHRQGLDSALIHAVIAAESAHNPAAVSTKSARGLMQLMPATVARYGITDVHDPAQNIQGGSRYLKDLLQRFGSDLGLTLAAYNAGENAVARHGNRIQPYRETLGYVTKVLDRYRGQGGRRT